MPDEKKSVMDMSLKEYAAGKGLPPTDPKVIEAYFSEGLGAYQDEMRQPGTESNEDFKDIADELGYVAPEVAEANEFKIQQQMAEIEAQRKAMAAQPAAPAPVMEAQVRKVIKLEGERLNDVLGFLNVGFSWNDDKIAGDFYEEDRVHSGLNEIGIKKDYTLTTREMEDSSIDQRFTGVVSIEVRGDGARILEKYLMDKVLPSIEECQPPVAPPVAPPAALPVEGAAPPVSIVLPYKYKGDELKELLTVLGVNKAKMVPATLEANGVITGDNVDVAFFGGSVTLDGEARDYVDRKIRDYRERQVEPPPVAPPAAPPSDGIELVSMEKVPEGEGVPASDEQVMMGGVPEITPAEKAAIQSRLDDISRRLYDLPDSVDGLEKSEVENLYRLASAFNDKGSYSKADRYSGQANEKLERLEEACSPKPPEVPAAEKVDGMATYKFNESGSTVRVEYQDGASDKVRAAMDELLRRNIPVSPGPSSDGRSSYTIIVNPAFQIHKSSVMDFLESSGIVDETKGAVTDTDKEPATKPYMFDASMDANVFATMTGGVVLDDQTTVEVEEARVKEADELLKPEFAIFSGVEYKELKKGAKGQPFMGKIVEKAKRIEGGIFTRAANERYAVDMPAYYLRAAGIVPAPKPTPVKLKMSGDGPMPEPVVEGYEDVPDDEAEQDSEPVPPPKFNYNKRQPSDQQEININGSIISDSNIGEDGDDVEMENSVVDASRVGGKLVRGKTGSYKMKDGRAKLDFVYKGPDAHARYDDVLTKLNEAGVSIKSKEGVDTLGAVIVSVDGTYDPKDEARVKEALDSITAPNASPPPVPPAPPQAQKPWSPLDDLLFKPRAPPPQVPPPEPTEDDGIDSILAKLTGDPEDQPEPPKSPPAPPKPKKPSGTGSLMDQAEDVYK